MPTSACALQCVVIMSTVAMYRTSPSLIFCPLLTHFVCSRRSIVRAPSQQPLRDCAHVVPTLWRRCVRLLRAIATLCLQACARCALVAGPSHTHLSPRSIPSILSICTFEFLSSSADDGCHQEKIEQKKPEKIFIPGVKHDDTAYAHQPEKYKRPSQYLKTSEPIPLLFTPSRV